MPITDAEERAARLKLIKFLRAGNVNRYKLDIAMAALEALERSKGCNTPAEEFLENILRDDGIRDWPHAGYRSGGALDIHRELRGCAEELFLCPPLLSQPGRGSGR